MIRRFKLRFFMNPSKERVGSYKFVYIRLGLNLRVINLISVHEIFVS